MAQPMKCLCGSKNCRGVIGGTQVSASAGRSSGGGKRCHSGRQRVQRHGAAPAPRVPNLRWGAPRPPARPRAQDKEGAAARAALLEAAVEAPEEEDPEFIMVTGTQTRPLAAAAAAVLLLLLVFLLLLLHMLRMLLLVLLLPLPPPPLLHMLLPLPPPLLLLWLLLLLLLHTLAPALHGGPALAVHLPAGRLSVGAMLQSSRVGLSGVPCRRVLTDAFPLPPACLIVFLLQRRRRMRR